jgi:hypothetical protein
MSPSFLNRVAQFARSPQGRRLADQAVRRARDPKTRRQIEQVRARLVSRGSGGRDRVAR